jgi:O-antigen/teichoic acid export membrane protein
MQKKFLTNLGLILFLNLLIKPFFILGIDRTVQNVVGDQQYGFYFSLFNFSLLMYIFLDLGITNYNNRNIARDSVLLNRYFSGIVVIKLLLGILYLIITFLTGLAIGYDTLQFRLLAWITLNQFLLSFILYLRSNISGLLLFTTDSFLSVADRFIMIVLCSFLLWGNITNEPFRIEWYVYVQTASYAITALIALTIVMRKASFRKLSWDVPFFLVILRQSMPFAILALLMSFYNRIDTVMLERLLPGTMGDHQAGIYAKAYRLLDASNMIAYLFSVLLLPIFSNLIKNQQSVGQIVKLSFSLLFTFSAAVAVGSLFYKHELMELLYTRQPSEAEAAYLMRIGQSASVFGVLMFGLVAISTTYVFGTLLTANGSLRTLNFIALGGMVISVLLNLILIPRYQSYGSSWASLSSQYITAGLQVWIAMRLFSLRPGKTYVIRTALFVVGLIAAAYLSVHIPADWKVGFAVFTALAFLLAIALRMLDIRNFLHILKQEQ